MKECSSDLDGSVLSDKLGHGRGRFVIVVSTVSRTGALGGDRAGPDLFDGPDWCSQVSLQTSKLDQ